MNFLYLIFAFTTAVWAYGVSAPYEALILYQFTKEALDNEGREKFLKNKDKVDLTTYADFYKSVIKNDPSDAESNRIHEEFENLIENNKNLDNLDLARKIANDIGDLDVVGPWLNPDHTNFTPGDGTKFKSMGQVYSDIDANVNSYLEHDGKDNNELKKAYEETYKIRGERFRDSIVEGIRATDTSDMKSFPKKKVDQFINQLTEYFDGENSFKNKEFNIHDTNNINNQVSDKDIYKYISERLPVVDRTETWGLDGKNKKFINDINGALRELKNRNIDNAHNNILKNMNNGKYLTKNKPQC